MRRYVPAALSRSLATLRRIAPLERGRGSNQSRGERMLSDGGIGSRGDDDHLRDVPDGAGCTEIWEHLSERAAEGDD